MISSPRVPVLVLVLIVGLGCGVTWASESEKASITHQQEKVVAVRGEHAANRLQTLTVAPTGEILALVALPRYGTTARDIPSEVQVYSPAGEKVSTFKVGFPAQAIAADAKGNILVAGSGKLAEFSSTGSLLQEKELPHLAEVLSNQDELRARAEQQLKSERDSYQQMVKQFTDQKEKLEKKNKDSLTAAEKAQLKNLEMNLNAYEQIAKQIEKKTVESAVQEMTSRLRTVNAVAVTEQHILVATGEMKGYGYTVWRMDRDLSAPKQVLTGLGGCCGQMDIQASGDKLYVAENTRHRVGIYDLEGKRQGSFGKRGRDGDPECFGSCCNPMNCRVCPDGTILTAESEGHVKRFSAAGEFLGPVGSAKISGGCKNVAVAISPDGQTVYFCDQPGSRIILLTKKLDTANNP